MENHIRNRTVLITGASSGFGRQLALDLLDYEVDLILVARSKNRLETLREELSSRTNRLVEIHALDVRDRQAVESALSDILSRHTVHILVNNAGLALGLDPVDQGNPDHWDIMIDTNLKGLLYVSKPVIAQMRTLESAHVVNIGSMAGRMPYPGGNAYCASKAAVHALGEAMNADL
ncbi:SDR family NAD(P)-dependent oxidoreductase, partial [Thiolapillus sp.]